MNAATIAIASVSHRGPVVAAGLASAHIELIGAALLEAVELSEVERLARELVRGRGRSPSRTIVK